MIYSGKGSYCFKLSSFGKGIDSKANKLEIKSISLNLVQNKQTYYTLQTVYYYDTRAQAAHHVAENFLF